MSSTSIAHPTTLRQVFSVDARHERARALLASGAVHPVADRRVTFAAWVESQARPGVYYYVTLGTESCECTDYKRRHLPCKHILAARYAYIRLFEQGGVS